MIKSPASSAPIHLGETEVHVWEAVLDDEDGASSAAVSVLSKAERERAESFLVEIHRRRYLAAHLKLRHILSRYLDISPAAMQFTQSESGKPELAPASSIRFNMAHSRNRALYAVSREREVGIDLEWVDSTVEVMSTARVTFSEADLGALERVRSEERLAAFYTFWTRKEAYAKATGLGLAGRLSDFDVAVGPDEAPALLTHRREPREINHWTFRDIPVGESFRAALAVEVDGCSTCTPAPTLAIVHCRAGM